MTNQEVAEVLTLLFRAFPSFGSWYDKHRDTVRDIWVNTLSNTEPDDAMDVAEKLIRGEIELPPNYEFDRVAILLKKEAFLISTRRAEHAKSREMSAEKFEHHKKSATLKSELERFSLALSASRILGVMVREKKITKEYNDTQMAIVKDWHAKGGEVPSIVHQITLGDNRADGPRGEA